MNMTRGVQHTYRGGQVACHRQVFRDVGNTLNLDALAAFDRQKATVRKPASASVQQKSESAGGSRHDCHT
jgi:hypothetical protein